MSIKRRIFISSPRDKRIIEQCSIDLKWAIINEVERLGYEPQVFGSKGGRGLAAGKSWNAETVDKIIRRCSGAVILGFPIWTWTGDDQRTSLVSEYCHYEGAIAKVHGLPILALLEEGAKERVIFGRSGSSSETTIMPLHADKTGLMIHLFKTLLLIGEIMLKKGTTCFLAIAANQHLLQN